MGNRNTKSKEEASGDEHLQVDRDRLEDHTKNHDKTSDHNAPSSSQTVCDVGNYGQGDERTDGHDTSQQAEQGARWVSEVYNLLGGLDQWFFGSVLTILPVCK